MVGAGTGNRTPFFVNFATLHFVQHGALVEKKYQLFFFSTKF
jgi:hypothetical protein